MENQKDNDMIEIDLLEMWGVLWRHLGMIMSVGLFTALLCFLFSRFIMDPTYESMTKIYILNKSESASVTYSDVQLGTQLTKDYAELITSRYVLEEVIQKLSLDVSYDGMLNMVTVTTPSDTRIVAITVKNIDPIVAMNIANCIREVASEHIQNVMDIEAVNIVETANMPTEKAGPNSIKWTLVGGVIGFFIMCAIILIKYLMDDTVKSSEDVERYLGLSTLALIPLTTDGAGKKKKQKRKIQ
ncbi:YveK family protein [Kineothrix sp. MB12-C1]|uniref:YveK family protein n=1 Tax=Kineothrix sp. MB12-C1 TaxID=3070215 RepID=UPI0027D26510|nr:Wzz/FepE/Etk N-terminal domain-containing protein [Kineothrix sp. MB12-C1]WMC92240.1 Wzz/FepE/Etk N-terminal domain-containing protein [Kineothrix sp. MB12-C1]